MDTLRVGIIGCGGNMRWHLGSLLEIPGVMVVGLCDPSGEQLETTVRRFSSLASVPAFASYEDLLKAVSPQATLISTPHTQHRSQVEACFASESHVLVEKPLATTIEDCEAMIHARDRSGKVGYLSYQRHSEASYRYVKKAIESGQFGKVQMVSALLSQEWKRLTAGSWRQDPELSGGGMFLDSGSHMLDFLLWATGLDPKVVTAHLDDRGTPVEINASVSFTTHQGALGTITICGDAPNWHEEIIIWLDGGAFFLSNGALTVRDAEGTRLDVQDIRGGLGSPDASFVRAIRGQEESPTSFEDGLRVMRLSQAAYDSAGLGGTPVEV